MYLPRPYPDELVGSMLHRTERILGIGREPLLWRLTGHKLSAHSFLITQYAGIAHAFGMSFETFLGQHTVFPYLTAFQEEDERLRLVAELERSHTVLRATASLVRRAVIGEAWLRFCPVCVEFELKRYGESYWHRMHQLCGVSICSDHKVGLYTSPAAISRAPRIPPPHEMVNSHTTSPEPSPTISIAIAMASTAALWRVYDAHSLAETYRQRARELGYVYMGGKVHGALLAHDMLNFYGTDFLRRYGCLEDTGPRLRWPGKMFQASAHNSTTFKHILLQVFLDSKPTPSNNRIDFEGRRQPKTRDWPQIEREAIECLTAEVSRHRQAGTRVNLEDLYDIAGIHSIVKTKKHRIPALMAWIEQFKKSPQSTRIPGRRPRR
ncbi:TnsD family Tn7-like transposition protein [Rhodoferax aquaticus]|uniref:Uncharacterized protein n=1 Tax=Rhodoferax aquaticus TaxID=2527691 RepID=A0A515EUU9_9BURK|nr:TnsD family Tn7-like transposition protein [Rhodoferax aquaticus]QDL56450.1 hypothetical protein EXZ61_21090 [Rhodoferax aquaticus]